IQVAADEHVLVVVMHHIISDGHSITVLVDEFVALYQAVSQNNKGNKKIDLPGLLPELPIQYSDYAIWQRNWLEAGERERQLNYWRQQLGDTHPVLSLSTDRPRGAYTHFQAARCTFTLSPALGKRLHDVSQSY